MQSRRRGHRERDRRRRGLKNELDHGFLLANEALDVLKRIAAEFPCPDSAKHPAGYRLRVLDEKIALDAEGAGVPVPAPDRLPRAEFSGELRAISNDLSGRIVVESDMWPGPKTELGKARARGRCAMPKRSASARNSNRHRSSIGAAPDGVRRWCEALRWQWCQRGGGTDRPVA
jgi:hypothetical protein